MSLCQLRSGFSPIQTNTTLIQLFQASHSIPNFLILCYSFARLPIGRSGVRARKYKSQYSNTPTAIHRRSTNTLASDEENTSEYSHPPSSQHSTLESNPDVAECIKVINQHTNDNLSDSSSGSESDDAGLNETSIPKSHFLNESIAEESNTVTVLA